jgi:acyl-coenzyme A thioesterase PaaI-like protein
VQLSLAAIAALDYRIPGRGDCLLARAWVVSAGQRLIVARCELLEPRPGAGEVCAIAQGTIARATA